MSRFRPTTKRRSGSARDDTFHHEEVAEGRDYITHMAVLWGISVLHSVITVTKDFKQWKRWCNITLPLTCPSTLAKKYGNGAQSQVHTRTLSTWMYQQDAPNADALASAELHLCQYSLFSANPLPPKPSPLKVNVCWHNYLYPIHASLTQAFTVTFSQKSHLISSFLWEGGWGESDKLETSPILHRKKVKGAKRPRYKKMAFVCVYNGYACARWRRAWDPSNSYLSFWR